jgi:hypothetical protein
MTDERPKYAAGKFGKYTCTRCGWKWTPHGGFPDPPRACARCRTAYWQTPPMSSRANLPEDPKWQAERDLVSRRRRERHLARLRELAAEFRLEPPPVEGGRAISPGNDLSRAGAAWLDSGDRFNDRGSTRPVYARALPPARPLAQELSHRMARSEPKSGTPSPLPAPEPSPDLPASATRRKVGYGRGRETTTNR